MFYSVLAYIFLFSVPLLPVVTLYRLFEEQSYFELSGVAKGIVATGPIAAYAVFAYVGSTIFKDLFRQRGIERKLQSTEENLSQKEKELVRLRSKMESLQLEYDELNSSLSSITPTQEIVDELVGDWTFVSKSSHDRVLTGNSSVQFKSGFLRMQGRFYENGEPVGSWSSESAQVIDNSLIVVYRMEEQKNGELQTHRGVCTFQLENSPFFEMLGFWVVVGKKEMFGRAEYKRVLRR